MNPASVVAIVLTAACTFVPPEMMASGPVTVAQGEASPFAQADVVVLPVTGTHPGFWRMSTGEPMVQPSIFRQAIVRSFRESGLFAAVADNGDARYTLQAEILQQDKTDSGVSMVVRYRLTERGSGHPPLTQDIETSSPLSADATPGAFGISPGAAYSRAAFRAAGRNLGVLIAQLRAARP